MHDVPGRIYVVIVVASVGQRRADLPRKTDHKRRGKKATHLFLLVKGAFALWYPNER
jgi:hypothetical protein